MEVGVQLPEVERDVRWPEYLAMARAAEEVGLASIWLGHHLLYRVGSGVRAAIARSACAAASRFGASARASPLRNHGSSERMRPSFRRRVELEPRSQYRLEPRVGLDRRHEQHEPLDDSSARAEGELDRHRRAHAGADHGSRASPRARVRRPRPSSRGSTSRPARVARRPCRDDRRRSPLNDPESASICRRQRGADHPTAGDDRHVAPFAHDRSLAGRHRASETSHTAPRPPRQRAGEIRGRRTLIRAAVARSFTSRRKAVGLRTPNALRVVPACVGIRGSLRFP